MEIQELPGLGLRKLGDGNRGKVCYRYSAYNTSHLVYHWNIKAPKTMSYACDRLYAQDV